ncbi:hypothetical protein NLJ89_g10551 [Agrocybe chaxingu]|uniref:Uncharacterized protein n=1 Tax=Agrocybe chaxingu TaxID=84603 RepID=A0A9W8JR19_9AGAR|nr:hypothetical protein NLJ89_g10551 [Agrocybe chaxingu]
MRNVNANVNANANANVNANVNVNENPERTNQTTRHARPIANRQNPLPNQLRGGCKAKESSWSLMLDVERSGPWPPSLHPTPPSLSLHEDGSFLRSRPTALCISPFPASSSCARSSLRIRSIIRDHDRHSNAAFADNTCANDPQQATSSFPLGVKPKVGDPRVGFGSGSQPRSSRSPYRPIAHSVAAAHFPINKFFDCASAILLTLSTASYSVHSHREPELLAISLHLMPNDHSNQTAPPHSATHHGYQVPTPLTLPTHRPR